MSSIIKGITDEQSVIKTEPQVQVPGYGTVPLEMLKRHVKELSKDFNGMIQSEEFIKAAYKTEQFYNALFALSKAMKAKSVEEGYSAGITGGSGLGIEKSPMEKVIEKPLGEGEVVSMQARKTPLVLIGRPFDWDIYDLRTGKVVANLLGGDRHDSPLYEIRINRNGIDKDALMKPTYVATGDVNSDGPHGIYELEVPSEVDKIEKSPGPGGTTKLRPDNMDMLGHMAKQTGQGKYYGYDLVHVADVDAYTWIEKVLGAKIMDVDDAMEAGYTDVDPEDPAGIIYTADQQNEGYSAGLGEKINTPGGMGQSYRKFTPKPAGLTEEKELSIQELATISDEALDKAYGYGRSSPGNTFGWQANLMSAAYAKKMIDSGVTDIEKISDAIHKGWNVTAQKFVQDPDQFSDTEKLRQAGKLDAKLQQRAKLMKINYAQLDNDEQEKDRVVARALLQALRGNKGVAEEQAPMFTPEEKMVNANDPRSDGWRLYKTKPAGTKESAVMKGIQAEGAVTRWSKENPPPPELLLNTLIQILMNPENKKSPQDLISLWNEKYGLKHTLGGLRQYAQNDYKKAELSKALTKAALAYESSNGK